VHEESEIGYGICYRKYLLRCLVVNMRKEFQSLFLRGSKTKVVVRQVLHFLNSTHQEGEYC
jgi:hypothetical protein